MAALELFHRIFTHAPEVFAATGWRRQAVARDAESVLSSAALEELDDLLEKLEPVGERAWAVRRFANGEAWFGCVVVSYHGFEDAGGRIGLLNHARVVRLEDPWFNPVTLIEEALAFPIDEVLAAPASERAQKYVDALSDDPTIGVADMHASILEELDRKIVVDVLAATLGSHKTRPATRYVTPVDVRELALSWAALPAGLQQWSSFAAYAKDGVPVDAIWSSSGTKPSAVASGKLIDCVTKYLNLLLGSSYDHSFVVRDMNVSTTVAFQQLIDRATIEAGAPAGIPPAEGNMGKGSRKSSPPRKRDEAVVDPELAELDRNYQAMYRSLRSYIDQRLDANEAARATAARTPGPAPAPRSGTGPKRRFDWRAVVARYDWRVIAVTVFLTIVLVLGVQSILKFLTGSTVAADMTATSTTGTSDDTSGTAPTGTSGTTDTAGTTASTTSSGPGAAALDFKPARDVVATCTNWDVCLADFSVSHHDLFAVIVNRMRADTVNVPQSIRDQLEPYSNRLKDRTNPMKRGDRQVLRPLLFEYVVKQKAADKSVDGNLNDVTTKLLQDLNLKTSISDVQHPDLHSEAILRWIANQGGGG